MKSRLTTFLLFTALICVQGFAQEMQTPPAGTVAVIPTAPEPALTAPAPVQEPPDFEIESTQVKLIEVVEAPPMAGLPPVEGTMTLKVHSVADPGIPNPTPPETQPKNQETHNDTTEVVEPFVESHLVLISATVYDNSRSLLTFNTDGGTVSVWSNIDFNHFSGIGNFEAKGADGKVRSYNLIMGIGNASSTDLNESGAPVIPAIPNGAPAFVIQSEVKPDAATLMLIEDLHALYASEGSNMAEAAAAREKAEEEKKAYLLANPPKPKDVTVHFWNREHSATGTEGAQP